MATPEANAAEEIINDRGGEDGKPPLPGSSPKSMPQQPQTPLQRHQDPPPVAGAKQQQEWTAAPSGDRTLEPAIVTRLRTTAVDDYRRSYRRFRVGKAHGATGERPKEMDGDDDDEGREQQERDAEEDEDTSVLEAETSALYKRVADVRRKYRSYRMGAAKGVRDEALGRITEAEARTTPVAQLAAFLRTQVAPSFGMRRVASSLSFSHRTTFHCHIGAGKLGLGLVVPAILRAKTPFAIIQRPSKAWEPISFNPSRDPRVSLIVNGAVVCKDMTVVRDLGELPRSDPQNPLNHLFVPSEDPLLLHLLVTTASSFSISLGPAMLEVVVPLLSKLPLVPAGEFRPCLFAAENDHKMVRRLAKALEGRVDVHEVMVDRICVDRLVRAEAIEVKAEPYEGEMVILKKPGPKQQDEQAAEASCPFAGEHVRLPLMAAEANYFCRRKFLLVNGTHTTLAFMTLCLRQPRRSPNEEETVPGDHTLISWDEAVCGRKGHKEIWAWAVARLLILLWEHELDLLRHAHGVATDEELVAQLLEYTTRTLQRFSSIKDTTKRVLAGGVANRWQGRLNDVRVFLQDGFRLTPIAQLLLKQAGGLRLAFIKRVVGELCDESFRFTGLGTLTPTKPGKVVVT